MARAVLKGMRMRLLYKDAHAYLFPAHAHLLHVGGQSLCYQYKCLSNNTVNIML